MECASVKSYKSRNFPKTIEFALWNMVLWGCTNWLSGQRKQGTPLPGSPWPPQVGDPKGRCGLELQPPLPSPTSPIPAVYYQEMGGGEWAVGHRARGHSALCCCQQCLCWAGGGMSVRGHQPSPPQPLPQPAFTFSLQATRK